MNADVNREHLAFKNEAGKNHRYNYTARTKGDKNL